MTARRSIAATLVMFLLAGSSALLTAQTSPKDDPRLEKLLSLLTREEKIHLLGGNDFETLPIPRLGIPPLTMTDGPVGVRWQPSSAFPVSIMMSSSWNPALVESLGVALGREARAKGRKMLLGPCVNIHRTPFAGRNFESFGEDPFLASRMAVAIVNGVQSQRVIATAKHYACNNQEFERDFTNVTVSERALREIYLPAFEAAVKEAGSMSVMSAYNKVNGLWCSENPYLLTDVLKKEWGFQGFIVSDWGAVHSTVPTFKAGLDVEMPTGKHLNAHSLLPALKSGLVDETALNEKVRRLLRTMLWAGLFDTGSESVGELNSARHRALAREVAREGMVLLKNENQLLPLNIAALKSLAVIGPNAATARTGGGGSSRVDPIYAVSPLDALRQRLSPGVTVNYAVGCYTAGDLDPIPAGALRPPGSPPGVNGLRAEYFSNKDLKGSPVLMRVDPTIDFSWSSGGADKILPADSFSVRWTGTLTASRTGPHTVQTLSDDGVRLWLDGALMIDNWSDHASEPSNCTVDLVAGKSYDLRIEYYEHKGEAVIRLGWRWVDASLVTEAARVASASDAVVLCVGLNEFFESEGFDRTSLSLPEDQVQLIRAVTAANKRTVVVLNSGAPVLMDEWLARTPALVAAWYPGEEGGNALADILSGVVSPSGKLPVTFLKRWEDSPAFGNYPGSGTVNYAEGVFVGYRHFDKNNLDVLFPFGHGLSYTTFTYSNLKAVPLQTGSTMAVQVSLDVKNTGTRAGADVVQFYVRPPVSPVERAVRELKGFRKISLDPGETATVEVTLGYRAFAYYDEGAKAWTVSPGTYQVLAGSSSRDLGQPVDLILK
jgi:beta-glucosidase